MATVDSAKSPSRGLASASPRSPLTSARVQKALVWTGPVMVCGWVGAFVVLAGFIPPPDPSLSPHQVVKLYTEHEVRVKAGLVLSSLFCMFLVTFSAAIYEQIRRIEGERAPLSMVFMCSAAILTLEFVLPMAVWLAASYRADTQNPMTVRALNDVGWIMFMIISGAIFQFASLGVVILTDRRPTPIYPRWAGYFNLWIAFLVFPAGIVVFFKGAPFGWNGIIGFFQPLTLFAIWIAVMVVLTLKAIDAEAEEIRAAEQPALPV